MDEGGTGILRQVFSDASNFSEKEVNGTAGGTDMLLKCMIVIKYNTNVPRR